MRKIICLLFLVVATLQSSYAHVGSPAVIMEGNAGPYKVLVNVIPPDVIPGIAKVTMYLQNGAVNAISFRAVDFRSGDEGAPSADIMNGVQGQPGQYSGNVWLMSPGSSSIQITIEGKEGKGSIVVPVVAVSTAVSTMPLATKIILIALGIFLFVLMLTIAGASVSSALTKAGEALSERRKKMKFVGVAIAAVFFSLIVYGGNAWWQNSARNYYKYMFKPQKGNSRIIQKNGLNELTFTLDTTSDRRPNFSFLVPDHGKLMHLFMIRSGSMDAFAHLHPVRVDSITFKTVLPKLPKGDYLIYADIVYNTGFTETIKDTINIPADLYGNDYLTDVDDAYAFAMPFNAPDNLSVRRLKDVIVCGTPGKGVRLKDSSTMVWEDWAKPYTAGQLYQLTFSVLTPQNQPASLDTYMGMQAHAVIVRHDGNVYIHLHPVGTFSMVSETNMLNRIADPQGVYHNPNPHRFRDSIDNYIHRLQSLDVQSREKLLMAQMKMPANEMGKMKMDTNNMVTFPYSFPQPGKYRIWVQVKRAGQILTAAFDKVVN